MAQDHESTVRSNFARMEDEELLERIQSGGLTSEAAIWIVQELEKRNLSQDYQKEIHQDIQLKSGLPEELGDCTLSTPSARFFAHIIDHVIAVGILGGGYFIYEPIGLVGYFGYYLFADALPDGRSIGKRMIGMKVIGIKTSKRCSLAQSFVRNVTMFIPVIGIFDAFYIFGYRNQRWGDQLADTIVIDY